MEFNYWCIWLKKSSDAKRTPISTGLDLVHRPITPYHFAWVGSSRVVRQDWGSEKKLIFTQNVSRPVVIECFLHPLFSKHLSGIFLYKKSAFLSVHKTTLQCIFWAEFDMFASQIPTWRIVTRGFFLHRFFARNHHSVSLATPLLPDKYSGVFFVTLSVQCVLFSRPCSQVT